MAQLVHTAWYLDEMVKKRLHADGRRIAVSKYRTIIDAGWVILPSAQRTGLSKKSPAKSVGDIGGRLGRVVCVFVLAKEMEDGMCKVM